MDAWIRLLLEQDPYMQAQLFPSGRWIPLSLVANPIRRTPAVNELVFDLDGKTWEDVRALAASLEGVFGRLRIPFLRFSSGRFLHYSVFFDQSAGVPRPLLVAFVRWPGNGRLHVSAIPQIAREVRYAVFAHLADIAGEIGRAWIDRGVMRARRHLIRFEGARHEETGFCKSLLHELPRTQPRVREEEVTYPTAIPLWRIPPGLIVQACRRRFPVPSADDGHARPPGGRIAWIEELLRTPISDGRHRAVNLILAPYLTTIRGMGETEAVRMIRHWIEACRARAPTAVTEAYIRYQVRYAARKRAKPLRWRSIAAWFGDVEEMRRLVIALDTETQRFP